MHKSKLLFLGISLFISACGTTRPSPDPLPEASASSSPQPEASGSPTDEQGQVYTLYVNSQTRPCVGVGPRSCLETRRNPEADWELFYADIDGFDYEAGFIYALKVRETAVENPPADASSLKYTLLEVLSKEAVESSDHQALAQTQWRYVGRENQGQFTPVLEGTELSLDFTEEQVSGDAGCNRFFGDYSLAGSSLSFGTMGSTRRACLDGERQAQEQDYLESLGQVKSWQRQGNRLELHFADNALLIFELAKS